MFSKKPKVIMLVCTIVGISVLTCGFTGTRGSIKLLQFTGKDHVEITLRAESRDSVQDTRYEIDDFEHEAVEVGQIIRTNGVDEVVFAIGSDGSYITIPKSD